MNNGQGNGSTPANPFTQKPEYQYQEAGLTKRVALPLSNMTLRQHFAMAAMQGILSNQLVIDQHDSNAIAWVAEHATSQADALLSELSK